MNGNKRPVGPKSQGRVRLLPVKDYVQHNGQQNAITAVNLDDFGRQFEPGQAKTVDRQQSMDHKEDLEDEIKALRPGGRRRDEVHYRCSRQERDSQPRGQVINAYELLIQI